MRLSYIFSRLVLLFYNVYCAKKEINYWPLLYGIPLPFIFLIRQSPQSCLKEYSSVSIVQDSTAGHFWVRL